VRPSFLGAEPDGTVSRVADLAPAGGRMTSAQYFALIDHGGLEPDDRVELLEGVIVTVAPANPLHEAVTDKVARALIATVGNRAAVRIEKSLHVGMFSTPHPDVAVVPGSLDDYLVTRPQTAVLVVEVADSSLAQDRITKAAIYAAAGIPEYWIVDLRHHVVRVSRAPNVSAARYEQVEIARRGQRLALVAMSGASVAVDDLVPPLAAL
jgi:Uma2 family endonuclease